MRQPAIATEKVTLMLLQNFDENTYTELQNTENDSQKIWAKRLKDQPAFAIKEILHGEVLCKNSRENILDEVFLSKIAWKVTSLKLTTIRLS